MLVTRINSYKGDVTASAGRAVLEVAPAARAGVAAGVCCAFSRSSCSLRSCSSRVSRFSGGLAGSGGFVGMGVGIGGDGVSGLGGSGTSTRNSVPPTLWTTGSPSFIATTWQKMFLCCPAGVVLSTSTLNDSSFESFVICRSGAVAFGGRPSNFTVAGPSNGVFS